MGGTARIDSSGEGEITITLDETWDPSQSGTDLKALRQALERASGETVVRFAAEGLKRTDGVTMGVLLEWVRTAEKAGCEVDVSGLPEAVRKLVKLARAVPERGSRHKSSLRGLRRIGLETVEVLLACKRFIAFLGEFIHAFGRFLIGRARFRKREFWVIIQETGVGALPIVGLLAILTGTILGFVGAVQLRKFGATIYMTDLVGLAMAREMGCLMSGIIMSGRTGAAFAAQIGTMKVNQEIDALRTLGLSPVEFLVLPRTLALVLMMPLLTLFANVLGWTGGFLVSLPMGINPAEYWKQLIDSLALNHIIFGISKSFFFGIVVAISGCYYGMLAKKNSAAVGQAATRAVVAGITWIVVLDAVFAFMDEVFAW